MGEWDPWERYRREQERRMWDPFYRYEYERDRVSWDPFYRFEKERERWYWDPEYRFEKEMDRLSWDPWYRALKRIEWKYYDSPYRDRVFSPEEVHTSSTGSNISNVPDRISEGFGMLMSIDRANRVFKRSWLDVAKSAIAVGILGYLIYWLLTLGLP